MVPLGASLLNTKYGAMDCALVTGKVELLCCHGDT